MARRNGTLTASQGSRRVGVIAGYVLKIARTAAAISQGELAESFGVDISTIQGWESGRRPLAATSSGDLLRLSQNLARRGVTAAVFSDFQEAIRADMILSIGTQRDDSDLDLSSHPLAGYVLRRSTANLVTWPFTGTCPQHLETLRGTFASRGPTPKYPLLGIEDRRRFFDHLMLVADRAQHHGEELLLRQALYLLGFDDSSSSAGWLRSFHKDKLRRIKDPHRDLEAHLASRSAAVALATSGDIGSLHRFVSSLADEQAGLLNLNYWAHWIGETTSVRVSDEFMLANAGTDWKGSILLGHLLYRLHEDAVHRPLTLKSLHTLVSYKPELLMQAASRFRAPLTDRLMALESSSRLTPEERDQVVGVLYALR